MKLCAIAKAGCRRDESTVLRGSCNSPIPLERSLENKDLLAKNAESLNVKDLSSKSK